MGVELEFNVATNKRTSQLCAVRLKLLPASTVQFYADLPGRLRGHVTQLPRRGDRSDRAGMVIVDAVVPESGAEPLALPSNKVKSLDADGNNEQSLSNSDGGMGYNGTGSWPSKVQRQRNVCAPIAFGDVCSIAHPLRDCKVCAVFYKLYVYMYLHII